MKLTLLTPLTPPTGTHAHEKRANKKLEGVATPLPEGVRRQKKEPERSPFLAAERRTHAWVGAITLAIGNRIAKELRGLLSLLTASEDQNVRLTTRSGSAQTSCRKPLHAKVRQACQVLVRFRMRLKSMSVLRSGSGRLSRGPQFARAFGSNLYLTNT
jgi:hypothetical protein